jgi:hypothetical protein
VLEDGTLTDLLVSASYQRVSPSGVGAVAGTGTDRKRKRSPQGEERSFRDVQQECLAPARLKCTLKIIDLVTSVEMRAVVRTPMDSRTRAADEVVTELPSGTPFFLQVKLTSDDCDFLAEPRLRDLRVTVQHSEGGGRANLPCHIVPDMREYLARGSVQPLPPNLVSGKIQDMLFYTSLATDSVIHPFIYSFILRRVRARSGLSISPSLPIYPSEGRTHSRSSTPNLVRTWQVTLFAGCCLSSSSR